MASAMVGSPDASCQWAMGSWLVTIAESAREPASIGIDHRPAQLVEQDPGRLETREAELALELERVG
jgi:hypothetical protein